LCTRRGRGSCSDFRLPSEREPSRSLVIATTSAARSPMPAQTERAVLVPSVERASTDASVRTRESSAPSATTRLIGEIRTGPASAGSAPKRPDRPHRRERLTRIPAIRRGARCSVLPR